MTCLAAIGSIYIFIILKGGVAFLGFMHSYMQYIYGKKKTSRARQLCSMFVGFCIFAGVLLEAGGGLNRRGHRSTFVVVHIIACYTGVVGGFDLLRLGWIGPHHHCWVGFVVDR